MNNEQPQGLWIFSAVNSRDTNQALKRLKTKGRETDITPEEMCDEMGISHDRAQWYPAKEERKNAMNTNETLRWSREYPEEPGWYWHCESYVGAAPEIVLVVEGVSGDCEVYRAGVESDIGISGWWYPGPLLAPISGSEETP